MVITPLIHRTALVDERARLGNDVEIGPYSVIGPDVIVEDGVRIGARVSVSGRTRIAARTRIFDSAVIGSEPQDMKYCGEPSQLVIGADTVIREFVTINPGTAGGGMLTTIGDHCLIMAGAHIGHDSRIGDHVILVNNVLLAGHVTIADHAVVGGQSAVHQFVRIGAHAMVGGMTGVEHDVVPFGLVTGNRARLQGLNLVGLRRRGFSRDVIAGLRQAYRLLFTAGSPLADRLDTVERRFASLAAVGEVVRFLRHPSRRSFCVPAPGSLDAPPSTGAEAA